MPTDEALFGAMSFRIIGTPDHNSQTAGLSILRLGFLAKVLLLALAKTAGYH